jgi:hypothetical protein
MDESAAALSTLGFPSQAVKSTSMYSRVQGHRLNACSEREYQLLVRAERLPHAPGVFCTWITHRSASSVVTWSSFSTPRVEQNAIKAPRQWECQVRVSLSGYSMTHGTANSFR